MFLIRMATAVEIPNGDIRSFIYRNYLPEAWEESSAFRTQYAIRPNRRGLGVNGFPGIGPDSAGSGNALVVEMPTGLRSTHNEWIVSPYSPRGQLYGSEQSNQDGLAVPDEWSYRLRFAFRGQPGAAAPAPVTGDVVAEIQVEDDSAGVAWICPVSITAAQWDNAWHYLASAPIRLTSAILNSPVYMRVRVRFVQNLAAVSVYASFSNFTIETLGPIDAAAASDTLAAEGVGGTYYEISREPGVQGLKLAVPTSFAQVRRLPSGRSRTFDPTGGERKRTFEIPFGLLTADDYERLWRLWQFNKGFNWADDYPSQYGLPGPLLLILNTPDHQSSYCVDFVDAAFPIEEYGSTWLPSDLASQRYKGLVRLQER